MAATPLPEIATAVIAPPVPPGQPTAGPSSLWVNFQALPVEAQITIAVAAITAVIAAFRWGIEKRTEDRRFRIEQARLDRQEQQDAAQSQADWRLYEVPAIGSGSGYLRLLGHLQNVGLATARVRTIQAYLDRQELSWDTGAPRNGDVQRDAAIPYRFRLPFPIEAIESRENWPTNTLLSGRIVRLVVSYADDSGERTPFVRCFRFEPGPQFQRWNCIEVDPCPPGA